MCRLAGNSSFPFDEVLARLWQKRGKKKEARQALAEVYGWFTEEFDTGDLQKAKALLEDLEETAKWGNGENGEAKKGGGGS
jgi:hypothetical protein